MKKLQELAGLKAHEMQTVLAILAGRCPEETARAVRATLKVTEFGRD
jgi:hypothetical protein